MFYVHCANGEFRIRIGDDILFDTLGHEQYGSKQASLSLEAGKDYEVCLEYRRTWLYNEFRFGWEKMQNEYDEALAAASEADLVIFCGGYTDRSEGEGVDRSFGMPKALEDLLIEVAKVNRNTVVVLTAGGNVDMRRWIHRVGAVVHAWYPGQEGGTAVAEILFGEVNPSAKLPVTFEKSLEDRSSFDCYHDNNGDNRVELSDGVFCGYRHFDREGIEPMFPFGFGLSYTTFAFEDLQLSSATMKPDQTIMASFDLTNTGRRAGAEVAQLYISDVKASLPRPIKELKGFVKVQLEPGERKRVQIPIDISNLQFYDSDARRWTAEPGEFHVLIGASAEDIRLQSSFRLEDPHDGRGQDFVR